LSAALFFHLTALLHIQLSPIFDLWPEWYWPSLRFAGTISAHAPYLHQTVPRAVAMPRLLSASLLFALACTPAMLRGEGQVDLKKLPPPAGLVEAKATVTPAALVCFLEGPAVDPRGNVYFSDIAGNRILKMDRDGKVSVFRADSGRTNGNAFDAEGRLISCEGAEMGAGGRRQVVRTDLKTGAVTVLTSRYEGKRYNSPNDVCVDATGRIWFTDPRYGADRSDLEMDVEGVYRIDPDGKVTRVLGQPEIDRPNGIAITPDGKTLYLVDSHPRLGGNRKIWAFEVTKEGKLTKQRLVFNFGAGRGGDGLKLDRDGNLWVAGGIGAKRGPGENLDVPPGVYVITPQGKVLGRIPIPEDLVTNLAFGGPERKTLYVTAGKTLYQIPVTVAGQ
jgi:gluconolactonase